MDGQAMFLDCPAYLGNDAASRCGLPAEVVERSPDETARGGHSAAAGAYPPTILPYGLLARVDQTSRRTTW